MLTTTNQIDLIRRELQSITHERAVMDVLNKKLIITTKKSRNRTVKEDKRELDTFIPIPTYVPPDIIEAKMQKESTDKKNKKYRQLYDPNYMIETKIPPKYIAQAVGSGVMVPSMRQGTLPPEVANIKTIPLPPPPLPPKNRGEYVNRRTKTPSKHNQKFDIKPLQIAMLAADEETKKKLQSMEKKINEEHKDVYDVLNIFAETLAQSDKIDEDQLVEDMAHLVLESIEAFEGKILDTNALQLLHDIYSLASMKSIDQFITNSEEDVHEPVKSLPISPPSAPVPIPPSNPSQPPERPLHHASGHRLYELRLDREKHKNVEWVPIPDGDDGTESHPQFESGSLGIRKGIHDVDTRVNQMVHASTPFVLSHNAPHVEPNNEILSQLQPDWMAYEMQFRPAGLFESRQIITIDGGYQTPSLGSNLGSNPSEYREENHFQQIPGPLDAALHENADMIKEAFHDGLTQFPMENIYFEHNDALFDKLRKDGPYWLSRVALIHDKPTPSSVETGSPPVRGEMGQNGVEKELMELLKEVVTTQRITLQGNQALMLRLMDLRDDPTPSEPMPPQIVSQKDESVMTEWDHLPPPDTFPPNEVKIEVIPPDRTFQTKLGEVLLGGKLMNEPYFPMSHPSSSSEEGNRPLLRPVASMVTMKKLSSIPHHGDVPSTPNDQPIIPTIDGDHSKPSNLEIPSSVYAESVRTAVSEGVKEGISHGVKEALGLMGLPSLPLMQSDMMKDSPNLLKIPPSHRRDNSVKPLLIPRPVTSTRSGTASKMRDSLRTDRKDAHTSYFLTTSLPPGLPNTRSHPLDSGIDPLTIQRDMEFSQKNNKYLRDESVLNSFDDSLTIEEGLDGMDPSPLHDEWREEEEEGDRWSGSEGASESRPQLALLYGRQLTKDVKALHDDHHHRREQQPMQPSFTKRNDPYDPMDHYMDHKSMDEEETEGGMDVLDLLPFTPLVSQFISSQPGAYPPPSHRIHSSSSNHRDTSIDHLHQYETDAPFPYHPPVQSNDSRKGLYSESGLPSRHRHQKVEVGDRLGVKTIYSSSKPGRGEPTVDDDEDDDQILSNSKAPVLSSTTSSSFVSIPSEEEASSSQSIPSSSHRPSYWKPSTMNAASEESSSNDESLAVDNPFQPREEDGRVLMNRNVSMADNLLFEVLEKSRFTGLPTYRKMRSDKRIVPASHHRPSHESSSNSGSSSKGSSGSSSSGSGDMSRLNYTGSTHSSVDIPAEERVTTQTGSKTKSKGLKIPRLLKIT